MSHDIFQSVPQGSIGAQEAENRRIEAIADEFRRRCKLYETQRRDGQSYVNSFEAEQRVAELFAKENGLWIPMEKVFILGTPGPSGNENDIYVSNKYHDYSENEELLFEYIRRVTKLLGRNFVSGPEYDKL